jgi:cell wall-associated NlpC family hydrolase
MTIYREAATEYAKSFIGIPYRWAGNDPMAGFDCSGFVIEVLKGVGLLPRRGDWTAAKLYDRFKNLVVMTPTEGCLVFYENGVSDIVHVEYCCNEYLSIGASGGNSRTITVQDAIENDAYVKMRPIVSRKYIFAYVDPFLKYQEQVGYV